jgi:hypothetical protein
MNRELQQFLIIVKNVINRVLSLSLCHQIGNDKYYTIIIFLGGGGQYWFMETISNLSEFLGTC